MAKLDKDLMEALKKAKATTKPKVMYFALVEKKVGEGTLIVSRNVVQQPAITEAQDALGGGKIYKGQCSNDPATGELVFETSGDPPDPKTLIAVIKLDAKLSYKVASKKLPPLTAKDVLGAVTADRQAELTKRLGDVMKSDTYKLLQSRGGAGADRLKQQMKTVKDAINAKDFKKAAEVLDEVDKTLATEKT